MRIDDEPIALGIQEERASPHVSRLDLRKPDPQTADRPVRAAPDADSDNIRGLVFRKNCRIIYLLRETASISSRSFPPRVLGKRTEQNRGMSHRACCAEGDSGVANWKLTAKITERSEICPILGFRFLSRYRPT